MFKNKNRFDTITEKAEQIKDVTLNNNETFMVEKSGELVEGCYTFYDNDPNNECAIDDEGHEKEVLNEKPKRELNSYFEDSKRDNSKIKENNIKCKKRSKKQTNKENRILDSKHQKSYVFRNEKYNTVDDFIKYLDSNYLDIDKISKEVLNDELFHGWISKNSGVFDDSIILFKEIKDNIEKK